MQKEPIRIAQVVGKMVSGGMESVVMNYYRNIDRSQIQFDFIVDEDSTHIPREEIESLGGRIYIVPPYQKLFQYIKELKKIFKENQYKIVHSHLNSLSVFPLYAAKKAKVPIRIAHSHSTSTKDKREWKRNILKNILKLFSKVNANYFFACTTYAGEWLFGNKIVNDEKFMIVNNAILTEKFEHNEEVRKELRKNLNLEEKFVLGHIGRFMHQKNHNFLIDIFEKVHQKCPESVLLLVGDGPLKEKIIQKVTLLGVTDCVQFIKSTPEVWKYYQAMDLFVFPSLYEGLGMVLVEAQIAEVPCIASSVVPEDATISNKIQYVSLEENAETWAKMILETKQKKGKIQYINKEKYDIKEEAKKLQNKYFELLRKC